MRAMWSGSVTFGLVNIPVKAYWASKERPFNLSLLHRDDLAPIHYQKVCELGHEVDQSDIVKGFKTDSGDFVTLEKEDFENANARKTHAIEIQSFADKAEIDTLYYEKPYYLEVDKDSGRAYALLNQALQKTGKVAIATFVFRQQESLGVIVPYGRGLVLNQLRFHEELRTNDLEYPAAKPQKGELAMAVQLIEAQTTKFDPEAYRDTYHRELMAIIQAKAKGKKVTTKGEAPEPTNVIDLMAALERSLKGRGGSKTKSGKAKPAVKAVASKRKIRKRA